MQARLESKGEVVVVHLSGRIDVETSVPFRKVCLGQLRGRKVVFNLRNLSFVGSSGLIPFFESMHEFGESNEFGLKFCAVGQEFRKIISATPLVRFEVLDNDIQAVMSYERPSYIPTATTAAPVITPVPAAMDGAGAISNGSMTEKADELPAATVEAVTAVDLFQMVRTGFEEKMRRPIENSADGKSAKE